MSIALPRFTISRDGRSIDDGDFGWDAMLLVTGDFVDYERRVYMKAICDALNAADITYADRYRGADNGGDDA